jgi:hypothetical protein
VAHRIAVIGDVDVEELLVDLRSETSAISRSRCTEFWDSFWALGGHHRAQEAGQGYIVAKDLQSRTSLTARFETKILGAGGGGAGDWNRTRGS